MVVDEQATMANFEIPRSSINKLSQAFRIMEQNKDRLGIVDYALSQSTLEQVIYISFLHHLLKLLDHYYYFS